MTITQNPIAETYFRPFDFKIEDGRRAYVDANGNFRTAFDEQSDEVHSKVAQDWKTRCIPASLLFERVNEFAKSNLDVSTPESNVRITNNLTLPDGTTFTVSGLRGLMFFAGIPVKMQDWLVIQGYATDLSRFCNESLDRREIEWAERGKSERNFMVRMRKYEDGSKVVRAVLSDKYGRFDNHEACGMIENALGSLDNVLVARGFTNQDSLMLDLVLPDEMQDNPHSQWGVGVSFGNNEIGEGTFSVEPYVFRTISRAGYRWGGFSTLVTVSQRHMGKINHTALQANVKKSIDIALTEGRSMLTILDLSQSIKISDPAVVLAGLVKEAKLVQNDIEIIARKYLLGLNDSRTDGTAFGIVEAIALAATEFHGERRVEIESVAGRLIAPSLKSNLQDIANHWSNIESTASRRHDADTLQSVLEILRGEK
jgi:hypothetical protein